MVVQEGKKKSDTEKKEEVEPKEEEKAPESTPTRLSSNKYANRLQRMARTLLHDFDVIHQSYRNDIVGQPVFDKKLNEEIKRGVLQSHKVKVRKYILYNLNTTRSTVDRVVFKLYCIGFNGHT